MNNVMINGMLEARNRAIASLCRLRYWPGRIDDAASLAELHRLSDDAAKDKKSVKLWPMCKDTTEASRFLRFEVDRDSECDLREWLYRNGYGQPACVGPLKFMGIDVYVVDHLPPPGWRIINPMA